MKVEESINYQRIALAITYIHENFKKQPTLEEIAEKVHLSPAHFQRLFTEWAGTSPKKFLQYISLEYAKGRLKTDEQPTLFDTTIDTGLSSTSRLHDLFVTIEGMSPAEYKHGGKNLCIYYSSAFSPFGTLFVASTLKGVCMMVFEEQEGEGLDRLKKLFPMAEIFQKSDQHQANALQIFQSDWHCLRAIKLHLKGTDFQLKVWESLLKIPMGNLSTYGQIAHAIGNKNASRAVGTAIGCNPIAFLIPCHRVIQSSGITGGYKWGPVRKKAIIGWEAAQEDLKQYDGSIYKP